MWPRGVPAAAETKSGLAGNVICQFRGPLPQEDTPEAGLLERVSVRGTCSRRAGVEAGLAGVQGLAESKPLLAGQGGACTPGPRRDGSGRADWNELHMGSGPGQGLEHCCRGSRPVCCSDVAASAGNPYASQAASQQTAGEMIYQFSAGGRPPLRLSGLSLSGSESRMAQVLCSKVFTCCSTCRSAWIPGPAEM